MDKTEKIIWIISGVLMILSSRGISEFNIFMWEKAKWPFPFKVERNFLITVNQIIIILVGIGFVILSI